MKPIGHVCLLLAAIGVAGVSWSHGGATGIVKERMDLMGSIGDSMKELVSIFKGEVPYDAATVERAASAIRDHASGASIERLFPEGSLDKPTEALPAIWEHWEEFTGLAEQVEVYSDALAKAAGNPRGNVGGMPAQDMMMGQGSGMTSGAGTMMMGRGSGTMDGTGPTPEHLATMPPDAAFRHLADTCNDCHTKFRVEDEE